MTASLHLPTDFGYVILVFIASVFVNFWHGFAVGNRRKKDKVLYPATFKLDYDPATKTIKQDNVFNCYQRSHMNFNEGYFPTMATMIIGGLTHPTLSAAGGAIWLAGRVVYAIGYQSGNPKSRYFGEFFLIGLVILLATAVNTAYTLINNGKQLF